MQRNFGANSEMPLRNFGTKSRIVAHEQAQTMNGGCYFLRAFGWLLLRNERLLGWLLLLPEGLWAQWECACQERSKGQPEKWLRTFKYRSILRHTSVVPNIAIPKFACSPGAQTGASNHANVCKRNNAKKGQGNAWAQSYVSTQWLWSNDVPLPRASYLRTQMVSRGIEPALHITTEHEQTPCVKRRVAGRQAVASHICPPMKRAHRCDKSGRTPPPLGPLQALSTGNAWQQGSRDGMGWECAQHPF